MNQTILIAEVPVIILTGQKDAATIHRCESLNTHYVPKQRDVWIRLQDTIAEILDERQRPENFCPSPARTRKSRGFVMT